MRPRLPLFVFVGLNEEFCKALPVLLVALFVPRSVNGALSGLGFAVVEFGYYVAYEGFEDVGWTALVNQFARGNFLGTHNHILWSATLGAAIGWAVVSNGGWKRIAVPLLAYIGVAATHSLQDAGGNAISAMLGGMMLEPLLLMAPDPEATMNAWMMPIQMYFGTVDVFLINVFVLSVLFVVLRRSGQTERRIIREQLGNEGADVVTPVEYEGVVADRRFKTRKIPGMNRRAARDHVQLQNGIAFQKAYAIRCGQDPDADPCVQTLRNQVKTLRAATA